MTVPVAARDRAWLPKQEVLELASVDRATVWRWIQSGKVSVVTEVESGRTLIDVHSLTGEVGERLRRAIRRRVAQEEISRQAVDPGTALATFLADHDADLHDRLLAEVDRRATALCEFAAIYPRRIDDRITDAVEVFRRSWPCTDAAVVAVVPAWGRTLSLPRLEELERRFNAEGISVLLPRRGRRVFAGDRRCAPIEPAMIEWLRAEWTLLQERAGRNRVQVTTLYRRLVEKAKAEQWKRVSYGWLQRWVRRTFTRADELRAEGAKAYRTKALASVIRTKTDLAVRDVYVGDHHEFDVVVYGADGRLFRPWLTAWQDMRSTALFGWHISAAPNSQTIALALLHAIRPKGHEDYAGFCGVPRFAYVDNGKDYRSHNIEGKEIRVERVEWSAGQRLVVETVLQVGLLEQLGTKSIHAIAYNARAKTVERWFKNPADDWCPQLPGYVGHNSVLKPERLKDQVAEHEAWRRGEPGAKTPFLHIDEFKAQFARYWDSWNRRQNSALAEPGRTLTPIQFVREYAAAPMVVAERDVRMLLLPAEQRKIRPNGVTLFHREQWFWHDAMAAFPGSTIEVRYDPDDPRSVLVRLPNGQVVEAASRVLGSMVDGEKAKAALEEARRIRAAQREATELNARLARAARRGKTVLEMAAESAPGAIPEAQQAAVNAGGAPSGSVTKIARPQAVARSAEDTDLDAKLRRAQREQWAAKYGRTIADTGEKESNE